MSVTIEGIRDYRDSVDGNLQCNYLAYYLAGRSDTPEWRRTFNSNTNYNHTIRLITEDLSIPTKLDWTPISYESRIMPSWALQHYFALRLFKPSAADQVLEFLKMEGVEGLPSLDEYLAQING